MKKVEIQADYGNFFAEKIQESPEILVSECTECLRKRVGPREMFMNYRLCYICAGMEEDRLSADDVLDVRVEFKRLMDADYLEQGQPEYNYTPKSDTQRQVRELVALWVEELGVSRSTIKSIVYWRSNYYVDTSHSTRERKSLYFKRS